MVRCTLPVLGMYFFAISHGTRPTRGFLLISGVFSKAPLSKHSLMTYLMVVCGRVRGSISSSSFWGVTLLSISVASNLTWMRRWSDT